jgi:hypothetical protein
MIINAGIIVKDDSELKQLTKAVNSIKQYVDGVYITANGEKVEEIKKYCKKEGFNYSYLKWDKSFANQRNFNFNQIPQNSDFIFWMDSDDLLIGGQYLFDVGMLAKERGRDVVFFTYWYGCKFNGEPSEETFVEVEMEHMRERLIKPGTHKWVGRLHETPIPISGYRNNYTKYDYDPKERPMVVMHTSTLEKAALTMGRNKEILELQLQEERDRGDVDPRTLLYLIKIYAEENDEKQWIKGLEYGQEYLKKSGWDEEKCTCWEQMAIITGKMNDDKTTIKYFHNAIREWPSQPLTYIRLAQGYYNVGNYRSATHWLTVASQMDLDNKGTNITNFKAMKVMFAQLLMKLSYNAEKNIDKSLNAAKLLYQEEPIEENKEQMFFIADLKELNDACDHVNALCKYLHTIGDNESIVKVIDALPEAFTKQRFISQIRMEVVQPRKWEKNEVCYFANFGAPHFEKWDGESYKKGIGGSETAVVELSKQFAKAGYKVTVYGDPFKEGIIDGVNYLSWNKFNRKDVFNIVIQWRNWELAGRIKCRKFYVDMHDVFVPLDFGERQLEFIDKIFVKSRYHRNLAPTINDDKFIICSNGI